MSEYAQVQRLFRDGKQIDTGGMDPAEWLLKHQSGSVDWACKHEGYRIGDPQDWAIRHNAALDAPESGARLTDEDKIGLAWVETMRGLARYAKAYTVTGYRLADDGYSGDYFADTVKNMIALLSGPMGNHLDMATLDGWAREIFISAGFDEDGERVEKAS